MLQRTDVPTLSPTRLPTGKSIALGAMRSGLSPTYRLLRPSTRPRRPLEACSPYRRSHRPRRLRRKGGGRRKPRWAYGLPGPVYQHKAKVPCSVPSCTRKIKVIPEAIHRFQYLCRVHRPLRPIYRKLIAEDENQKQIQRKLMERTTTSDPSTTT